VEVFDQELGDKYELVTPNSKGHKVASLITEIYDKNTYKSSLHNMDMDLPQGVMIDIFPLEYAPLNPFVRKIKGTVAMILQYIAVSSMFYRLYCSPKKKAFFYQTKEGRFNYNFRRFIGFFFSFRSYEKWCNTFDKFVRCKKDTGLCCLPTDVGHYFGHLMPKEVFFPPIEGPFEDMTIKLPHDIHAYLVNAYGDYMWIPPVEQREKHWTVGFCMDVAAEQAKKAAENGQDA
jgi:lipopolysaccharide cholinephosphotransferase